MRISDWSSDVCSSDLAHRGARAPFSSPFSPSPFWRAYPRCLLSPCAPPCHRRGVSVKTSVPPDPASGDFADLLLDCYDASDRAPPWRRPLGRDRKSCLVGTSVYVGVDLGGCRSSNKIKTDNT